MVCSIIKFRATIVFQGITVIAVILNIDYEQAFIFPDGGKLYSKRNKSLPLTSKSIANLQ